MEDLPRPEAHPAAPRRWSPRRPGELESPADVPWGDGFGTPGPDAGYALVVLADREIPRGDGEMDSDVGAALAALMVARASRFGRAPVVEDAERAELLLGYRSDGIPGDVLSRLGETRRRLLPGVGHSARRARDLVAALAPAWLDDPSEAVHRRLAAGEIPFVR